MDIILKLSEELGIRKSQAEAAVKLIDEGNTIPFIARYRKEVTGSLNDEVLRNLYERLTYLRNLEERKETVLNSIEEQGKLTDEFREQHPAVPWRQIKAMRNIVAHSYGTVDPEITWEIITDEIPRLKAYCEQIIATEQ